jgi:hypothetical protein
VALTEEQYVPTTEEIQEAYLYSGDGLDFRSARVRRGEEFDAWLIEHDAEVIRQYRASRPKPPKCPARHTNRVTGRSTGCTRKVGHNGHHSHNGRVTWS